MALYFTDQSKHIAIMADTQDLPQIFDHSVLHRRRARAARRNSAFLIERTAKDAAERICDINRTFETALILGPQQFVENLTQALPADKQPAKIIHGHIIESGNNIHIASLSGAQPLTPQTIDLVISGLHLQSANNLPGALFEIRKCLSPDGLFIGAMFGGETLTELRQSFYAADDRIFGGMSAHIYPFADYSQSASLLQRVGYALPVIDADRFTVRYGKLQTLIDDLRDLGETNCLAARASSYQGKAYRAALETHYRDAFEADGRLAATFEILWLTGWAPHESQQKPLKPGSAKMRLADALGSREKKL